MSSTRKEYVIEALRHHKTEFVPYTIFCTTQAAENVVKYTGDENYFDSVGNCIDMLGFTGHFTEIAPGYFEDEFSVVWNRTGVDKDIGMIEKILIPEPDISLIHLPEVDRSDIRRRTEFFLSNPNEETFKIAAIGFSMFERAWSLCSMENLLIYMHSDEVFVHTLLDRICEYNMEIINTVMEYDAVDCFHFGDDWGQQKGLIMGPLMWRRYIKPQMIKMFKRIKKFGRYISLHSCGDINDLFPELIDAGLDIYNTFQPEIYNIEEVKLLYGEKLTFWGGISTQTLLPFASSTEVINETKRLISLLSVSGGYIAAPTHAIPSDVPPKNIVALVDFFRGQDL